MSDVYTQQAQEAVDLLNHLEGRLASLRSRLKGWSEVWDMIGDRPLTDNQRELATVASTACHSLRAEVAFLEGVRDRLAAIF